MTVDTRLRRALVDVVGVALDAVDLDMLAGEREGALRVVEGRALPGVGLMAGAAIRAELPLVLVVFLVAADTRLRRALVDVVGVALDAVHLDVLAGEREGALRVVEGRALPGVGLMAGAAIRAELPLVLVVFLVAADTGRGRGLQVGDRTRTGVAAGTIGCCVLAGQGENIPWSKVRRP